ncbi:MAG: hypothetical protein QOE70_4686 [Chthoniobacter sp.]|jgi:hypothetical protein|nr:hypothetical protein [Chthoniobacter sp.]
MKLRTFPLVLVGVCLGSSALAQPNLISNWNFADPTLKGWRVDFPYQEWSKKNVTYVKQTTMDGKRCAVIELPPGLARDEGGKIETALVPAVPGATYRIAVEALLPDFGAKVQAEAYAVDPRTEVVRKDPESKGTKNKVIRIPEMDGHPPLVMIYRAPMPELANGTKWNKVEREFTLPLVEAFAGQQVKPAYLTVRASTSRPAPTAAGKAYFTNFKLQKIKDPAPGAEPSKRP